MLTCIMVPKSIDSTSMSPWRLLSNIMQLKPMLKLELLSLCTQKLCYYGNRNGLSTSEIKSVVHVLIRV
jgi:hypothetical protein